MKPWIKYNKILLFIFIVALCLRLFAVFTQGEYRKVLYCDAKEYDVMGLNIASGNGFTLTTEGPKAPVTHRVPMYSLFLASIYIIFGHSYVAVEIIQAILGAFFCIVVFYIAKTIYDNRALALTASFITAVYRPFIFGFNNYGGPAYILSDYFYMFMAGIAILCLLFFIRQPNKKLGMASGILTGLAILTRPEFAMYAVVLIFYLFYISGFSVKKLFKSYLIVYIFIILTLTPWIARNYVVTGKFIPLTTYGGAVFLVGNNSLANGSCAYPKYYSSIRESKEYSEYEQNSIFFKKAVEELRSNPKRIPGLFIKKILVHWAPFDEGLTIFNPYYAVIFLFGAAGILFFRKRNVMEGILIAVFISQALTASIIFGFPRFRYPCEPYLIIFSALAIYEIMHLSLKIKRRLCN